jgi:hypothetical protein
MIARDCMKVVPPIAEAASIKEASTIYSKTPVKTSPCYTDISISAI